MNLHAVFIAPFADYPFMRRALVAGWLLAISGTPLGLFMNLRRMALAGDAMAHAILPGVAVAFLLCGLQLWAMTLGGMVAGLGVAVAAGFLSRATQLKEDASFTLIYMVSIASGVLLISLKGSNVDLLHLLFGNILAIDTPALLLIAGVGSLSLLVLAAIYRALVISGVDPDFMQTSGSRYRRVTTVFFMLVVMNLVAAFQVFGTLMALGIMLLPAMTARFWTQNLDQAMLLGMAVGGVATLAGLLLSYHQHLASGASVVLVAALITVFSVGFGRYGSVLARGKA